MSHDDLEKAIFIWRNGQIDDRRLVRWATMILLNDCFLWDDEDDQLAESLHEISIGNLDVCELWAK